MTCSAIEINLLERRISFYYENNRPYVKIGYARCWLFRTPCPVALGHPRLVGGRDYLLAILLYRRAMTSIDEVVTA